MNPLVQFIVGWAVLTGATLALVWIYDHAEDIVFGAIDLAVRFYRCANGPGRGR